MEIGPIAGIRVLPALKTPPPEAALTALFDIEATAKAGDDTYSGSGKKAAGAEEDEELEEEFEEVDESAERGAPAVEERPARSINYFA